MTVILNFSSFENIFFVPQWSLLWPGTLEAIPFFTWNAGIPLFSKGSSLLFQNLKKLSSKCLGMTVELWEPGLMFWSNNPPSQPSTHLKPVLLNWVRAVHMMQCITESLSSILYRLTTSQLFLLCNNPHDAAVRILMKQSNFSTKFSSELCSLPVSEGSSYDKIQPASAWRWFVMWLDSWGGALDGGLQW